MQYGSNWYWWWSEIHPYTPISFRIRITDMLLASCNTCNIRMTAFQTQNRPTDRYDQIRWIPLTLFRKSITIDLLPHTSDVLVLHLRRANYQIFLWKSACSLIFNLLTLLENGWGIENRKICTECWAPQFQVLLLSWQDSSLRKDAKQPHDLVNRQI